MIAVIELLGFAEVVVRPLLMSFLAVIKWPEKCAGDIAGVEEKKCQGEGERKRRWRMVGESS